jgi:prolyl-tRNA editing enzyme YbaK/EbsC (Cys-tRNA(Pro) deacylase)
MAFLMEQLSPPERVLVSLREAGLQTELREFAQSTRTAQDAAAAIGTTVAQIVKSLVFLSGDRPVLALVSGSNRLDPAKLSRLTGKEIRKADAAVVRRETGYVIGGVPPAGFPQSIETYIDRDLLRYDEVWAAAGTPHHVFRTTPQELIRLTGGATVDLSAQT